MLDEVHHYGSPANRHIFDFLASPFFRQEQYHALGLSATTNVRTLGHILEPCIGPVFYRYGLGNALGDQIVNEFVIFNIAVHFNEKELATYNGYSDALAIMWAKAYSLFPVLTKAHLPFMETIQFIKDHDHEELANNLENTVRARRDTIIRADIRLNAALEIIRMLKGKTILFTERIEQVEAMEEKLKVEGIPCLSYQSNMETAQKARNLEAFRSGMGDILLCCKALDEGLDVPDCDNGIVLSTPSTTLQRIQRIGRIIRRAPGKRPSSLYYLHVKESIEDSTFLESPGGKTAIANLEYINDEFIDKEYMNIVVKFLQTHDFSNLDVKRKRRLKRLLMAGTLRAERFLATDELAFYADSHPEDELLKLLLLLKR